MMTPHTPTSIPSKRSASEEDEVSKPLFIRNPNTNDVLFGRGIPCREHSGSKQYHEICKLFREEYRSTSSREAKNIISYKIINAIGSLVPPGRFLQLIPREEAKTKGIFKSCHGHFSIWEEMDSISALTKVKQSLRDISRQRDHSSFATRPMTITSVVSSAGHIGNLNRPVPVTSNVSIRSSQTNECNSDQLGQTGERANSLQVQTRISNSENETSNASGTVDRSSMEIERQDDEDETAEDIWKAMAMDDAPKITEEEIKSEKESLTEVERMSVLQDLFGKSLNISAPAKKRLKRSDPGSITSLLLEMREAIDLFPKDEKSAVLDARTKADASEFSDDRLKQFLLREDMDPQKAAQRFVTYWSERRQLFGPEKYLMNMTLDGALRDDLPTLKACIFCYLPRRDSSGRSLIFMEQSRRNPGKHTLDSMLRAYWYVLETVVRVNTGKEADFVVLTNEKNLTIWDYDQRLQKRILEMENSIFPVRLKAVHACFIPRITQLLLKPILFAALSKRERQRIVLHDATESELPEVLARDFGLLRDMLPTEMGGTVKLCEWIVRQEALESEGSEEWL